MAGMALEKLHITPFTIPYNTYLAKVTSKAAFDVADVEVLLLAVPCTEIDHFRQVKTSHTTLISLKN